jgi:S1-C subfamily serine protease
VGGKAVKNPSEVQLAVDQGRVGQPLEVSLRRGDGRLILQLKPEELPRKG